MFSNQSLRILLYALPAAPVAALYFPVFVYLAEFYSSEFGISIAVIGVTFLIVRLFDGFLDPVFGYLSDIIRVPILGRSVWLLISTPILIVSVWNLYMPDPKGLPSTGYFIFWLVISTIGWSAFITPYYALGTELTQDYNKRSVVAICREASVLTGTVIAACIYAFSENSTNGFRNIAYFIMLTLPVFSVICVISTKKSTINELKFNSLSGIYEFIWNISKNRPYLKLVSAYFINGAANGLPASLFIYFVNAKLNLSEYAGILLLVYFISAILAVPVWIYLGSYIIKPKLWCLSMVYASGIFFFVIFVGDGDLIPFLIICCLSGTAVGADLGIPASIQADIIDIDTQETGDDRAGLFFAVWSIITKSAIAISSGLGLILLSIVNFSDKGENSGLVLLILTILYCVIPILLKLVSVIIVWSFVSDKSLLKS